MNFACHISLASRLDRRTGPNAVNFHILSNLALSPNTSFLTEMYLNALVNIIYIDPNIQTLFSFFVGYMHIPRHRKENPKVCLKMQMEGSKSKRICKVKNLSTLWGVFTFALNVLGFYKSRLHTISFHMARKICMINGEGEVKINIQYIFDEILRHISH